MQPQAMEHNVDMYVLGTMLGVDRRSLLVSAVFLSLTISTVIVAYFSFGDASDDSDIAAIQFAAIVRYNSSFICMHF